MILVRLVRLLYRRCTCV